MITSRDDAARFLAAQSDQQVRSYAVYALTGHEHLRQERYNRAATTWLRSSDADDADPDTRAAIAALILPTEAE